MEKINTDVVISLTEILNKVSEIDISILVNSSCLNDIVHLLHQTCL